MGGKIQKALFFENDNHRKQEAVLASSLVVNGNKRALYVLCSIYSNIPSRGNGQKCQIFGLIYIDCTWNPGHEWDIIYQTNSMIAPRTTYPVHANSK